MPKIVWTLPAADDLEAIHAYIARMMGGKPCVRGMHITVGTIVGLLTAGKTPEEILEACPHLEAGDISDALAYAAWCAGEADFSSTAPSYYCWF